MGCKIIPDVTWKDKATVFVKCVKPATEFVLF